MNYQLHDYEIDSVVLENDRIIFSFPNGFFVADEDGQELKPLKKCQYKAWSNLKKQMNDLLCDSLKGKISYSYTSYHEVPVVIPRSVATWESHSKMLRICRKKYINVNI